MPETLEDPQDMMHGAELLTQAVSRVSELYGYLDQALEAMDDGDDDQADLKDQIGDALDRIHKALGQLEAAAEEVQEIIDTANPPGQKKSLVKGQGRPFGESKKPSLKRAFIIREALAPDSAPGHEPLTPAAERIMSAVEMFVNHHEDYDGKPINTIDNSAGNTVVVGFKDVTLAKKFVKDITEFLEDTDDGKVEHGEISIERMHSEYPWTVFIDAPKSAVSKGGPKPDMDMGED